MMRRLPKKLLVANRGEIALRIIRTARAMGIKTVAVYSEVDAAMPHVGAADDAIAIGPAEPAASYLNIEALLDAARRTQADALHPGYGFLSERPEFARAVTDRGLLFIGPPAEVMAALGDKVAARRLALEVGVPIVPGLDSADATTTRDFAARVGFPLLVKAAAGGGGRGMRLVESGEALEDAVAAATREAHVAFGDGRIFVEKYISRPRHVEVQVIADHHGHIVTLGERDCSVQRRHQKLVEESPAPHLPDRVRRAMETTAAKLFRAVSYHNAGTAEFLVDGDNFYFLEANTRLQVEHPVTEMRYGIDLVALQILVAAGEPLSDPAPPRGHAIEVRICAEDAQRGFQPAAGRVQILALPAGPNVRFDSFLAPDVEVSPFYDSLLGKLVTWGTDRDEARRRLVCALDEFMLAGVMHNAAFLRDVVSGDPFAQAQLSTGFIQDHFMQWRPTESLRLAALIGAVLAEPASPARSDQRRSGIAAPGGQSPWQRLNGFEPWSSL